MTMRTVINRVLVFGTMFLPLVAVPAFGNTINVFSTGVGAGAAPGFQDPNWTVGPVGQSNPQAYVTDPTLFPFPNWFADTASSAWISPEPNYANNPSDQLNTTYAFQTTFTLPSEFPDAWLSFLVATDNALVDVLLNGKEAVAPTTSVILPGDTLSTAVIEAGFTSGFGGPFTIDSGFQSGVNTLTFLVRNSATNAANTGNPVGLNVELSGAYAPEPAAMLLIGTGLTGLAVLGRRRRSKR